MLMDAFLVCIVKISSSSQAHFREPTRSLLKGSISMMGEVGPKQGFLASGVISVPLSRPLFSF